VHLHSVEAIENPLVQRTNGSWYHQLVRGLVRCAHRAPIRPGPAPRPPLDALSGIGRTVRE